MKKKKKTRNENERKINKEQEKMERAKKHRDL